VLIILATDAQNTGMLFEDDRRRRLLSVLSSALHSSLVGYGLGTRDNKTRPNVLRAVLSEGDAVEHDWETDTVTVLPGGTGSGNSSVMVRVSLLKRAFTGTGRPSRRGLPIKARVRSSAKGNCRSTPRICWNVKPARDAPASESRVSVK
jgi:hypothetical protein